MHYYFFKNRYGLSSLSSTIYLDDDDDDEQLNSQQDNWRIEKFLKELFYEPQVFDPLPELQNMNVETESTTIPQMMFIELYDKILQAEKNLDKKHVKCPVRNMRPWLSLSSWGSIGEKSSRICV